MRLFLASCGHFWVRENKQTKSFGDEDGGIPRLGCARRELRNPEWIPFLDTFGHKNGQKRVDNGLDGRDAKKWLKDT